MSAVSTQVLLSAVLLLLVWPDVSQGWGSNSLSKGRLLQLQRLRAYRSYHTSDGDGEDDDDDDYPSYPSYPSYRRNSWRNNLVSIRRTIDRHDIDFDDYLEDYHKYRQHAFSRLRQIRDDYYRNRKNGSGRSNADENGNQSLGQRRAAWGGRQANNRGMSRLNARLREYLQTNGASPAYN
ncbi:uncharacterized protein LOC124120199 [Haliotis rufescens]|uniref:uncharacterized protein LOC124120199 n=1 Tax=Haliotis rufescens TaxID=6454 RepID=UPI001EAF9986|nr:uncharacterized protein LOC124120199 [Haliotis rufescens]